MPNEEQLREIWAKRVIPAFEKFQKTPTNPDLVEFAHSLEGRRMTRAAAIAQAMGIEAGGLENLVRERLQSPPDDFPLDWIKHAYNYAPSTAYIVDAARRGIDLMKIRRGEEMIVGRPTTPLPGAEVAIFSTYGLRPDYYVQQLRDEPDGLRIVWGVYDDGIDKQRRITGVWSSGSLANGKGLNELVFIGALRFTDYQRDLTDKFGDVGPLPDPNRAQPKPPTEAEKKDYRRRYNATLDHLLRGGPLY